MFSTKKGEKEEGSFEGFSSGYNIFIILFIASMLSFAIRGTLNGTYGKNMVIWKSYRCKAYICAAVVYGTEQSLLLLMQMLAVLRNESRSFQLPSIFNTEQEV